MLTDARHALIPRVEHAVVVGAGTMGARIACLLASAGATVDLLDVDERTAAAGLEAATACTPLPLLDRADLSRIQTAALDELEDAVRTASWVVEAIVEDVGAKRELLARVDDALLAIDSMPLVSTNTSALSIRDLAEDRSKRFRGSFLGTHFFNPPRHMRLLELIPSPWLSEDRMRWVSDVATRRLGKGIVVANDTPGFIANRLGSRSLGAALSAALGDGMTVEEADLLTGRLIGRPGGVFRLYDRIGIDVALSVGDDLNARAPHEEDGEASAMHDLLRSMVEQDLLGDKRDGGFYRRSRTGREVLDLRTLSYRPFEQPDALASDVERLMKSSFPERLHQLASLRGAARLAWSVIEGDVAYAVEVGPEISANVIEADRAMRWGWGWTLGPFQTADLLSDTDAAPGHQRYYDLRAPSPSAYSFAHRKNVPFSPVTSEVPRLKDPGLPSGESVSAHDLGANVLGIELHGKLNVIDASAVDTMTAAFQVAEERFDAAVLFTDARDFSAGADLRSLLAHADDDASAVGEMVRSFQRLTTAIRRSSVPVVAAARGRTLGRGAELCLAATRIHALTETYMGLVETAVGLLPAGGGLMTLARNISHPLIVGVDLDFLPLARRAVEHVMRATPSGSAGDARNSGLMSSVDTTSADPDGQLDRAIALARLLADSGHRRAATRRIRVLGRRGIGALDVQTWMAVESGEMTEHDAVVAREVIRVVCGGDVPFDAEVDEEYLLDLERDAFLRLLATSATRERILYTLQTGKPLRN